MAGVRRERRGKIDRLSCATLGLLWVNQGGSERPDDVTLAAPKPNLERTRANAFGSPWRLARAAQVER